MLYYCNAILAGLPASTLAPLQQVMHAPLSAARVDLKPYDNVTPALKALHWLPIKQRTEIQVVSPGPSSHQQQGTAPVYLQNLLFDKLGFRCHFRQ